VAFKLYAPAPGVSISGNTDVVCNGQDNGTVTLQVSNPVISQFRANVNNLDDPSKSFGINSGIVSGSNTIGGLSAGRWQIVVINNFEIDTYGVCNTPVSHTVVQPSKVTITFDTPLHHGYAVRCYNGNTGETTANGNGGVGGYKEFSWSTGATTAKITGLTARQYKVSLKDNNGCLATDSTVLTQPAALQVTLSPVKAYNNYAVSCWDHDDGRINSAVTGGITTQAYTYAWSNGGTGSFITNLKDTTYRLTVTDANGCTASAAETLTAPPPIDFTIAQTGTLLCKGDRTVSFAAQSVVNTIGDVTYSWSTGEQTSSVIDKGAGSYTLTVSDEQGCSTAKVKTLSDPPAYSVKVTPASNYNGAFIKCNGDTTGVLSVVVKAPDSTVTTASNYLWTHNGTKIGESASLTSMRSLSAGLYAVVITYNGRCTAEDTYFLDDPDPLNVSAGATSNYNGQPIRCHNGNDANIRVTAGGGTPAYRYSWDTGDTTTLVSGVGAGTYVVTVRDANKCIGTASVTLDNPSPVEADITAVSSYSGYGVSCSGGANGSMTAEGSGGTGVYSYAWSNGRTTPAISGLTAGSYTVTVSDNNGCSDAITEAITSPAALTFAVAREKDVSCFGGSDGEIELESSGGVGTHLYSRDNGSSWHADSIFTGLPFGNYNLLLRDGNGCGRTTTSTLSQPDIIKITFSDIAPAYCNDPAGTATAVVTGGVAGYTYQWQNSDAQPAGTGAVLSNARGGVYTVIVTDSHTCQMTGNVPITSTDGAKSTYASVAARCFDSADGSSTITITEGDGPFVIEWPDGQEGFQALNLARGTYNVEITDGHDCTVVESIVVPAPDAVALNVQSLVVPTCFGNCDGQMTLAATGGVGNYTYAWNNKTEAAQTQLCAGIYPVVVTDANGCVLHEDVELAQPDPIAVNVVQTRLATCRDGCDGLLEVQATGGNGGYTYQWPNSTTTPLQNNICPGAYRVTVLDQKGCQGEGTVELDNTPALPLDLGGGVTLCVGQSHTLDAGSQWVSVKWSSSTGVQGTQRSITVKDPGTYWLEVISDKGCVGQDTFLLETSYDLLKASFLIPGEAVAGDTVVMIDVSWPMPERVEWTYPLAMTEVMDLGDVLLGQFDEPGTYEVSLTVNLGECRDQISKQIVILKGEDGDIGGRLGYEAFVKTFMLHPNPNDGAFEVEVELRDAGPILLSVWSSSTGMQLKQVARQGSASYIVPVDLRPLSAGTYILRLDHAEGKDYIRFIVY
jgi:hypothetical protein